MQQHLLWIDLQLTSRREDAENLKVLEFHAVMTNSQMKPLGQFGTYVKEAGAVPQLIRMETDPDLREGYASVNMWESLQDGISISSVDVYLDDALKSARQRHGIKEDGYFTVVCQSPSIAARIITQSLPRLKSQVRNFIDVKAIKTFADQLAFESFTDEELDLMFRPISYQAEVNNRMNMEAIALVLSKLPIVGIAKPDPIQGG